jgi:ATP-dependent Clp protease adaptor protein ClpS
MEFVVYVLITVFRKDHQAAFLLMLETHHQGSAVVAVLPFEEAELRQSQVHSMASKEGFPLRCIIEPA